MDKGGRLPPTGRSPAKIGSKTDVDRRRKEGPPVPFILRGISDDAFAEQRAPVLERKYDHREGAKSLKQATADLSDRHFEEQFETQWAAAQSGLTPAQLRQFAKDPEWVAQMRPDWTPALVSEYVRRGALPPAKVGMVGMRFRQAAAAQQQALLEQLQQAEQTAAPADSGQQAAAVEQQQPAQQPQPQEQQAPPDPAAAERAQLARAAQSYAVAAHASEGERRANDQSMRGCSWPQCRMGRAKMIPAHTHNPVRREVLYQSSD
jgi:hypothetical protein